MSSGPPEHAPAPARPGPFRVLCVCEGNICRSPVAALLLQAALGPSAEVTSAGTRAVVGAPVAPPMAALLPGAVDAAGFRARQLRPELLESADLVLTMTRRQRRQAVELLPGVVRRTFTLRELARLLDEDGPGAPPSAATGERLRQAAPTAAAHRRFVADPRGDDIADPYGREEAAYTRAYSEIADAVARVSAALEVSDGSAAEGQSASGSVSSTAIGQKDAGGTTDRDAASTST